MTDDQEKHEARKEAHEAGVEGASKMTAEDAKEATQAVRGGADPDEAKEAAKQD